MLHASCLQPTTIPVSCSSYTTTHVSLAEQEWDKVLNNVTCDPSAALQRPSNDPLRLGWVIMRGCECLREGVTTSTYLFIVAFSKALTAAADGCVLFFLPV